MKIAIIGRTGLLLKTINLIRKKSDCEIVLIGTCKASPEYSATERDFEAVAKEMNVPFFCNSNINAAEIIDLIKNSQADIALSMNWISIIKEDVIRLFRYGILNAHPGDLPRYRGNACPNWAIINKEDHIGVTIHHMEANSLDSGKIIKKRYILLDDKKSITRVYEQLNVIIPNMFYEVVSDYDNLSKQELKQNNEEALRCFPRKPEDSFIDWNNSTDDICRLVRASSHPFQGAYFYFGTIKIRIWNCRPEKFHCDVLVVPGQVVMINKVSDEVGVATNDGILVITESSVEGSNLILTDVVKSLRDRFNYRVEDKMYELEKRITQLEVQIKLVKT